MMDIVEFAESFGVKLMNWQKQYLKIAYEIYKCKKEQNMKRFDINDYKGDYVMHCTTEEQAKTFCKYLHSVGRKWASGLSYLEKTYWNDTKKDTCYNFNNDMYNHINTYKGNSIILEFGDFYWPGLFTKSDLKDGMVVEHRDGDRYMVLGNILISDEGNWELGCYNNNLIYDGCHDYDICYVYRVKSTLEMDFEDIFRKDDYLELIWKREEPYKEMTVEEIEKQLGHKVKIVGEV